jgi:hypothetical protein
MYPNVLHIVTATAQLGRFQLRLVAAEQNIWVEAFKILMFNDE